ncbi:hypothetical protein WR25_01636 [Diploscapter pachys]|uniref:DUF4139 domain-containing protein n=1 Tax=Diploscapter pachys TaxID=2018661 RepID=A0A2A2JS17_9BILA|nr:hypothetical protein WR25_01636 [Diploscapter pachys]
MIEPSSCSSSQRTFVFEASDLPTKNVIVYCDRAEVRRLVVADLPKGTNEILIQNVSAVIERQSVRVDGRGALIQEVQYQEMPIDTQQETEKVQNLERNKFELENEKLAIEDEISSLRKRTEVLDGVAAQIASGPCASPFSSNKSDSGTCVSRRHTVTGLQTSCSDLPSLHSTVPQTNLLNNEDTLANLAKFLNYYGETVSGMKGELRAKQREADSLTERIDALERQIDQLRCGYEYDSVKRNISIIVEMETAASVELFVTYQVYCASWKPAYDIRASTAGDEQTANSVQLCYYGLVEQNTGDDWRDTELVLSTASPSLGGAPPPLATLAASLHKPKHQRQRHGSARRKPMSAASEEDMGFGSFDYNEIVDAAALHRYNACQMSRSSEENSISNPSFENLISTCFSIPRAVTIHSNGIEHKVLVAMVDLSCAFFHECVPSRCSSAFLSATVTNTATFPLLPGPAAIYLNNSFIAKTHLRAIAPGEEFRCSLGADPAVKVEQKSPTTCHEQVGFMSKSTLVTHEQVISLRNAKVAQSVQITVREQIPKSVDEKIKVAIISPEIKRGQQGEVRLNREGNLEWTTILAPGQHRDLIVKYTIEYPSSESVTFKLIA